VGRSKIGFCQKEKKKEKRKNMKRKHKPRKSESFEGTDEIPLKGPAGG